ncbi:geranylgeranyl reductase family protein [Candidatus Bathyarchaeota archaeon]|nr:geranylgeranyl reductase family protein [Candidatus Bathyarchaeota archaeon]
MEKFDLLVIGAGSGGCLTAYTAAKAGLKVGLMDCKPEAKIGDKVCGDAIAGHHFNKLEISAPSKGLDFNSEVKGVKVISPDQSITFKMEGRGMSGSIVDRFRFGQRLLKSAIESGAEFQDSMLVIEPLTEQGYVRGVTAKNLKSGRKDDFHAKVTIDATGIAAAIKNRLPEGFVVEREVSKRDFMVCHREIRGNVELEQGYCQIYLSQSVSPAGYFWVFPRDGGKVNVGVGIQASMKGPHPKTQLYNHVLQLPFLKDSKLLHAGGGYVPTRRPLDCFVENGLMIIGDAACMVNPIHGGGIGPSMFAGKLAGEISSDAIMRDDVSRKGLWQYNADYMKGYGAKQAGLDIFRIFLQEITDDELNYGMKNKLVKESDVLRASVDGDLKLSIGDKAERAFRNIRRLDFLIKLRDVSKKMHRLKNHYFNYPSIEQFPEWRAQIKKLY